MRCDLATVLEAFGELQRAGYKRPEIPRAIDDLAGAYLKVLADLPPAVVAAGTARFLRDTESRYWPKPAELRKHCLNARREVVTETRTGLGEDYMAWERRNRRDEAGNPSPCPVCGAALEPAGRITWKHDYQRHRELGVMAIG